MCSGINVIFSNIVMIILFKGNIIKNKKTTTNSIYARVSIFMWESKVIIPNIVTAKSVDLWINIDIINNKIA